MRTCSLTVKGPGLIETPKILTLGTTRAQRRPRGKESSWATIWRRRTQTRGSRLVIGHVVRSKNEQTYAANGDRGIPEEEELVHAGDDDGPDDTYEPCTEGVDRHVRVVGVGDGGADLGIRGIILKEQSILVEVGVLELRNGDDGDWRAIATSTMRGHARYRRAIATHPQSASRHRASRRRCSWSSCPPGRWPWRATRRGGRWRAGEREALPINQTASAVPINLAASLVRRYTHLARRWIKPAGWSWSRQAASCASEVPEAPRRLIRSSVSSQLVARSSTPVPAKVHHPS